MSLLRRHFLFGSLSAPLLAANKTASKKLAPDRPNIVLIVAEELGAYMIGCYGNKEVHTPNIDRLAQTGVRFHAAFSCAPITADQAAFTAAGYTCARCNSGAQIDEFLEQQTTAKPFFLAISWPSPNAVTPAKKNVDLYANTSFESVGWNPIAANATHRDPMSDVAGNMRKYAAGLTTLDDQLPAIHAKLQKRGVAENTTIVFASSGGFLLGRHGLWGDATASKPVNLYEEIVRVPLIWTWPLRFPPETVRTDVVNSFDLMPALCELAGAAAPAGSHVPSYLAFVYGRRLGKKQSWPDVALGRIQDTEMARDDRYKVILRNQGKGPNELYDETVDPKEQDNQYDNPKFTGTRDRLSGQIAAWRGK